MKVETKTNYTIIKDTKLDFLNLLSFLDHEKQHWKDKNLILDLSQYDEFKLKDLLLLLPFQKDIKKQKKSFVVVLSNFDFNANTKKITVVPSVLEAHDIIELEEIERDLGF